MAERLNVRWQEQTGRTTCHPMYIMEDFGSSVGKEFYSQGS